MKRPLKVSQELKNCRMLMKDKKSYNKDNNYAFEFTSGGHINLNFYKNLLNSFNRTGVKEAEWEIINNELLISFGKSYYHLTLTK